MIEKNIRIVGFVSGREYIFHEGDLVKLKQTLEEDGNSVESEHSLQNHQSPWIEDEETGLAIPDYKCLRESGLLIDIAYESQGEGKCARENNKFEAVRDKSSLEHRSSFGNRRLKLLTRKIPL